MAQSPCVLQIFHVICHYLRFSIINLISVAWTGLERERGGNADFHVVLCFRLLINTETMLDHPHCMFSDFFSIRNKQERKKIFHMTINLCLVENKTRGMEPQWSPCKAFSLTDIETIVVWSVSFSIIWQRHWERIGKILSSNCKHVLKVRGEYQRICLHEVFI